MQFYWDIPLSAYIGTKPKLIKTGSSNSSLPFPAFYLVFCSPPRPFPVYYKLSGRTLVFLNYTTVSLGILLYPLGKSKLVFL